MGTIGVIRCYQYNREMKLPLSTPTTPCATTYEEVWKYTTEKRYQDYQEHGSVSMMDHFYDKLLHLSAGFTPSIVANDYFVNEAADRTKPLLDICVAYGTNNAVPIAQIEALRIK